eukprot:855736-Pyramimonas_sp.AAC.1
MANGRTTAYCLLGKLVSPFTLSSSSPCSYNVTSTFFSQQPFSGHVLGFTGHMDQSLRIKPGSVCQYVLCKCTAHMVVYTRGYKARWDPARAHRWLCAQSQRPYLVPHSPTSLSFGPASIEYK